MQLTPRAYSYRDIVMLPLRCSPAAAGCLLLVQVLCGIAPTLEVLFIASFLDAASAIALRGADPYVALGPIALVVLITGWNQLVSWHGVAMLKARLLLAGRLKLRAALTEKRARLTYRHIEEAEAWDLTQRVCKEPEKQMMEALDALMGLAGIAMRIVGLMALLLAHVWWAAVVITAITVPLTALAIKSGKAGYQAERDNTKIKRKYEYLSDVLMGRDAASERALFGYSAHLNGVYKDEYQTAYRHAFKVRAKWFVRRGVSGLIFALIALTVSVTLLPATLAGTLSFGLFVSLTNAVTGMISWVAWSLGWQVENIAKRREGLRDLSAFLALSECEGALEAPGKPMEFEKLELKNVRFTYPGTEREILSGITLTIEKGGHYAFVGVNGAGKTTLTKILTGLYGEYEGEILLNGKSLRAYSQAELKACFALVYQDFARYNVSVRDNVAFGLPGRAERAEGAVGEVGLADAVAALPQGYDTPLGKVEGEGQDLSGGEWQRLAMARAIVNDAPVRILDEPTAALDPISESNVYSEFERMSRGRTTIFISHRLGSTRLADTIYVLGEGRVLEHGAHDELMARGGLYADMYQSQRSWYE